MFFYVGMVRKSTSSKCQEFNLQKFARSNLVAFQWHSQSKECFFHIWIVFFNP